MEGGNMKKAWFISDLHFGHSNILAYCPDTRPFASQELIKALENKKLNNGKIPEDLYSELDKAIYQNNMYIVNKINDYVNPTDTLWILGDVAYGRQEDLRYVEQIVCRNKNLVLGNHDLQPVANYTNVGFNKVHGMARHKEFILTHAPIHPTQLDERYSANIHGHLHTYDIDDPRYFNVNIDRTNCTPVSLQEIRDEMRYNEEIKNKT